MKNKVKIICAIVIVLLLLGWLRLSHATTKTNPAGAPPPPTVAISAKPIAASRPIPVSIQAPVQPPAPASSKFTTAASEIPPANGPATSLEIQTVQTFVNDTVRLPLMNYRMNTGLWPASSDGLESLLYNVSGDASWHGPYLDSIQGINEIYDPWGNEYQYQSPGTHNPKSYDVWSMGPDGISGTADDIGNWK